MIRIDHFTTPDGQDTFQTWLDGVPDRLARQAVLRRVRRLASGLFGDWRACRSGVMELRVDVGPGYRIYFARPAPDQVVLIGGGTKRSQPADIDRTARLWREFEEGR